MSYNRKKSIVGSRTAAAHLALAIGDVVVFARRDHFVVHRVVGWTVDATGVALITRGGAKLHNDAPVHPFELLGVAVGVHRFGTDRAVNRSIPATLWPARAG